MNLQKEVHSASIIGAYSCAKEEMIDKYQTEQNDPLALSLDENGMIQECSRSIEKLFGFSQNDLLCRHFSMLFPQLTGVEIARAGQINPLLNYLCRCGHHFLTQNRQGEVFTSNLSVTHIGYDGSRLLRIVVRPSCGQGETTEYQAGGMSYWSA
jgi:PAS domain S-box-containing protein